MPLVTGDTGKRAIPNQALFYKDLNYKYPDNLDLRPNPDNKLHWRIWSRVMDAADESYKYISKRFASWQRIDEIMTGYIYTSDYEKNLLRRNDVDGDIAQRTKPISIILPNSFAVEDTILTYLTQTFLTNPPVFEYEGVGSEDTIGAKKLELEVQHQMQYTRGVLELLANFKSALRYGLAATSMEWVVREGLIPKIEKRPVFSPSGLDYQTESVRTNVPGILYEGNELFNIDPYRTLPDPNVSAHKAGHGAFFGWTEITDYNKLLDQEQHDINTFNVRYLDRKEGYQIHSFYTDNQGSTSRERFFTDLWNSDGGVSETGYKTHLSTNKVTVVNMYMEIIPKTMELTDSDVPEIWFFRIADGEVIIEATPLGLNHGQIPIAMNAPDYDGYIATPVSRLEVVQGLQTVSDFMINSHVANVRKAIHEMFLVDPQLVHMPDFMNPMAGLLIRLRPEMWGRGTKDALTQLRVSDVTQGHISDSLFVNQLMQRGSGAVDALQGIQRSGGERVSATESQASFSSAVSRLEKYAFVSSAMLMQTLGYLLASHTQQFMSEEVKRKILGSWPQELRAIFGNKSATSIAPEDLFVSYDIVPCDGSTATSASGTAETWVRLFQTIGASEILVQQFDTVRIFMHIAKILGAKNIQDFAMMSQEIGVEALPEEAIETLKRKGNVIPLPKESVTLISE